MCLTLFPPDITQRSLSQILHHARPESVGNFVHQPWWKLPLRITLSNIVKNTAIFGCSGPEYEARNVRDCPEKSFAISLNFVLIKQQSRCLPHVAFFGREILVRYRSAQQHLLAIRTRVEPASLQNEVPWFERRRTRH